MCRETLSLTYTVHKINVEFLGVFIIFFSLLLDPSTDIHSPFLKFLSRMQVTTNDTAEK